MIIIKPCSNVITHHRLTGRTFVAIDALPVGRLEGLWVAAAGGWPVGRWVGGTFSVSPTLDRLRVNVILLLYTADDISQAVSASSAVDH